MRRHIVVVEDEIGVQSMLCDVIQSVGDTVLGVEHAGTALALLKNTNVDLIVIDLMLPDMPGTHLAAALREDGQTHTPMIAISADYANLLSARRSGLFQEVIRKPFDVDELLRLVDVHAGTYITQATE